MDLKHIILHQIKKNNNEIPELNCSDHLLDATQQTIIEFVESIISSFRSKNPTYGRFEEDKENYPFQKWIAEYRRSDDFLIFSRKAMDTLKANIQIPKAKGGYVLFAHYIEKQVHYLVTVMLDKSAQFTTDDDSLDIKKLHALDINKLSRANRLNISKWELGGDETYLAFIKGTKEVTGFFQKFIGSTDSTSSRVNSNNLKLALNKFMRENGYDEDLKDDISKNIFEYMEGQRLKDEDVHLNAVSAIVSSENPTCFMEYVQNNDDLEVSGSFRVGRKADIDFLNKATVTEPGYKLTFQKALKHQEKIRRDGNNIIISDVPSEILDEQFGEE